MSLTLARPIASIDLESTGLDPIEDRIIQFGVRVIYPDGQETNWEQMFNPGIPIKPEATEKHRIYDEMVADKPPFSDFAAKIHAGLQGKDVLGYNLRGLDLPMLDTELRRCGLSLDLTGVTVIDAFGIFAKKEPRDLTAAVEKYCGRSHEGAHGALADAVATYYVLLGQRAMYEDVGAMTLEELAKFCLRDEQEPVDLAGKLYRDNDGDVCFGFGKSRGKKVKEDVGYAEWMLRGQFSGSTKDALRAELKRLEEMG